MSKRVLVKLAVTITALSAMTVLQGCGDEEDGAVLGSAWGPVGSIPLIGFTFTGSQGTAGGSSQSGGGGGGGQGSGGGTP